MKIKQICLIISIIGITFQLNLRQSENIASNETPETEKPTPQKDSSEKLVQMDKPISPLESDNTQTQQMVPKITTSSNTSSSPVAIPKQQSAPSVQTINKPSELDANKVYNEIKIGKPLEQPAMYRPSAMVQSTPVCANPSPMITPTPMATQIISTPVMSNPIPQAVVRPYARALPPIPTPSTPPLRVFVPEPTPIGIPVHQPSPPVEAMAIPASSRIAAIPPSASAVISQQGIAVSQPVASSANPVNEKDIKITVNKKKKGKIELTISAQPKENNI